MIEVALAKNGSAVHLKNGKYLASSFDPQKEAKTWWKNCERLTKHVQTVVVLGLGSGYHILAVKAALPNVKLVVVDNDSELIDLFKKNHGQDIAELICEPDWRRLFVNSEVNSAVQDRYAVLLHPASYNVEKEYFANAYKFLLARSVEGFFALLKLRPELLSEIDESKLAELARSTDPVTIRTLTRTMKPTTFLNENRRLWKVLEELIA